MTRFSMPQPGDVAEPHNGRHDAGEQAGACLQVTMRKQQPE